MSIGRHPFLLVLLAFCLAHLGFIAWREFMPTSGIAGFLYPDGTPVGGDFINLWTSARMLLEGRVGELYIPSDFMRYQIGWTGAEIGHRIWAYPPHSLLLIWPFGLLDYYPSFWLWSGLGLAVLTRGCRRIGLGWLETTVILLSPATVLCIFFGQTGNLTVGLFLLALSVRPGRDGLSVGAAMLLTIKPQTGLLLPLFWLFEKRWFAIAATAVLTLIFVATALALFGPTAWFDYVGKTLSELSQLERKGTGSFMLMIPSIFMAMRIVTGDGVLGIQLHILLAAPILGFALWRLWRLTDVYRRMSIVLVATVLISPYIHSYDLGALSVGALLVLRNVRRLWWGKLAVCLLVLAALMLPQLVVLLNVTGWPLSPLVVLGLLLLA